MCHYVINSQRQSESDSESSQAISDFCISSCSFLTEQLIDFLTYLLFTDGDGDHEAPPTWQVCHPLTEYT